jgi:NTP pyrophosphatase (non-canonical NTP hydrolase)|tara:strand:- start:4209 stop:4946 length:738 start_codon:yes stop_codon:yes gene_type:complete
MYYIYHIEGVKVGCTVNPAKRIVVQQGYSDFEILAKTKCIDEASKLEFEWQNKLGYKNDIRTYKQTINNFMIHITKTTVTFKKTFNKSFDNYTWPTNIELDSEYNIELNDEVKDYILRNNFKSAHNNERYIYVQSLKNFWDVVNKPKVNIEIFDNIRTWAKDRGLYDKGNAQTQYVKLIEEAGELAQAILKQNPKEIEDAIGDMVVVLTNLAHLNAMSIEECIHSAYNEIKNRKGKMQNGTFVKE